eukprot:2844360-Amphidinium_carterae.1
MAKSTQLNRFWDRVGTSLTMVQRALHTQAQQCHVQTELPDSTCPACIELTYWMAEACMSLVAEWRHTQDIHPAVLA